MRAARTNARELQPELTLRHDEQTLAVYPADVMPPPYPVAFPVDREAGIARYRALPTPAQYRARLAAGDVDGLVPPTRPLVGEPPVFPLVLKRRVEMAAGVARFELAAPDGGELPAFDAGAHIDVVVAPEYLRPFSLAGDPADRRLWVLGVQREPPERGGRGGSALMHRSFRVGRRVFVSRPRNHFALVEDAGFTLLFAGGIGVTALIAMAHRLHALGRRFEMHYSAAGRAVAGFLDDLAVVPWRDRVRLHFKDEGARADLPSLIPAHAPGMHLYTCGPARLMDAVFAAASQRGWPDAALHREHFQVLDAGPRVDRPFVLRLARSGRRLDIPAGCSATDVLAAAGVAVSTKCSDGLCGVCATRYDAQASAAIDHRDVVLSAAERADRVILCCSRARDEGGEIVVDL